MRSIKPGIHYQSFVSQRGFSLLEIMVAAGLLGALSLGMISLQKSGVMGQKSLLAQDDARKVVDEFATLLADPTVCFNSFGGGSTGFNPKASAPLQATITTVGAAVIKDKLGATLYTISNPSTAVNTGTYGNRNLKLRKVQIGGTKAGGLPDNFKGNQAQLYTQTVAYNAVGPINEEGLVVVQFDWLITGTSGNQSQGPNSLLRYVLLNAKLKTDGSNQILSCTAVTAGSTLPPSSTGSTGTANFVAMWLDGAGRLTDSGIYNSSGNNVGIGVLGSPPVPVTKLHILTGTANDGITLSNATNQIATLTGDAIDNETGQLSLLSGGTTIASLSAAGTLSLSDSTGNTTAWLSNTGELQLGSGASSSVRLSITGPSYFRGGNVGIGTATPIGELHVEGSNGVILNAGNVGIGTTAPNVTLDINGTARLRLNAAPPFSCNLAHDGAIAANSQHQLCICNSGGAGWVLTTDGVSVCNWITSAPTPCAAQTISSCSLPSAASGSTVPGTCVLPTVGACSYTCASGSWAAPSSNTCAAPLATTWVKNGPIWGGAGIPGCGTFPGFSPGGACTQPAGTKCKKWAGFNLIFRLYICE
jgi:prepilin-type N-terminal cleavage/methylation domain-containing protein